MHVKSFCGRVFCALVVLAALVIASLPAQAQPVRRPATGLRVVAVSGDTLLSGIWRFAVRLWPGTAKEGTSIDPDGNTHPTGTPTTAAGDLIDEGMSIDPNG